MFFFTDARGQNTPVLGFNGNEYPFHFEDQIKLVGITYSPNIQYISYNFEDDLYDCDDSSCPLRKLALLHGQLRHVDGQCEIMIYFIGIAKAFLFGKEKINTGFKIEPDIISYNRIKSNFKYGNMSTGASPRIIEDLKNMVHFFPEDSAKTLFNADYMLSYPYDMESKNHQNDFISTKTVVFGKNGMDVFLYFVLTNKGMANFDKYLSDFRRTLWFEN